MKRYLHFFVVVLLLAAWFMPVASVFAEDTTDDVVTMDMPILRKTVAEVLGELAFNLMGVDRDKTAAYQQDIDIAFGNEIIKHLEKRGNEANVIFKKLFTGDYDWTIWKDVADFLIPTDDEFVEITVTDELKSAIGEAVKSFPEEFEIIEDDFTYLGNYTNRQYNLSNGIGTGGIFVPYNMPLDSAVYSGIDIRIVGTMPVVNDDIYGSNVAGLLLRYSYGGDTGLGSGTLPTYDDVNKTGFTSISNSLEMSYFRYDMGIKPKDYIAGIGQGTDGAIMTGLIIRMSYGESKISSNFDVYVKPLQKVTGPNVINKGDIFNSTINSPSGSPVNYNDMSAGDIFNYFSNYTPKDVTVNHYVQNDYEGDFVGDYEIPPYENNAPASSGFWGFLDNIAKLLGSLIAAIGNIAGDVLGGLVDAIMDVIYLIIPDGEDIAKLGQSLSDIMNDFTSKFEDVTSIGSVFSDVFGNPNKDLFDIRIDIFGKDYNILPAFLKDSIALIRTFLSGVVVLFTALSIYKRFVGTGDVIK